MPVIVMIESSIHPDSQYQCVLLRTILLATRVFSSSFCKHVQGTDGGGLRMAQILERRNVGRLYGQWCD